MKKEENIITKERIPEILFPGNLRDYFAAKDLSTFLPRFHIPDEEAKFTAKACYQIADAMLVEREK